MNNINSNEKINIGDNMNISRILDIREENELTQEELSNIIGGSRVNISKWENAKEIPNIRRINKMANYFHLSLDYIFRLSNKKTYTDINFKDLDKSLTGKRIISIRNQNNLTLRDLAKQLNTTSSTISAYENGKTLLLTAFAIEICKKYKVSMDWLYGKRNKQEL